MITYQEALDWLYSFVDHSATRKVKYSPETFSLERMRALLALLDNPQQRYPCLHLAGTKGKGSVSALCANVLRVAGYRTGLYTSPHLHDFRERIRLDGEYITEDELVDGVTRLRELAPQVDGITTFELTTALAFDYFARRNVDIAVIEVGLGGRLDATNVITPLISVITSLSYDHTDLLGHTLAQIAAEKAGIIKPGVPVISSPQQPEALAVLENIAAERGAPFILVGRHWHYRLRTHDLDGQTFEIWSEREEQQLAAHRAKGHPGQWRPPVLSLPLLGAHQVENAATAYAALYTLRAFLPLSPDAVREGFATVRWPGRFEVLRRAPFVVADGAHNADSARRLVAALDDYLPGRRVHLIFGASADKDIDGMLEALIPRAATVICSQAVHPRALEPDELLAHVRQKSQALGCAPVAEAVTPVASALAHALKLAQTDEVIVACGSLFIVA
ncbi:MAG: folylpolyglutamate synthase/dihydrofolate synthase family protein, partial [Anaerolineales bacterium]|nr:folylpolyglutamate synthase/dihydrofolate synthase family protein [Anaerolineales bacterium]